MASKAQIDSHSNVLDLGCGNGAVAVWLCREFGCRVTGVDLSGVRIQNAKAKQQEQPPEIRDKLTFLKSPAANLTLPDGTFSHVWSQAVIYHVNDKEKALSEIYRVLAPGGTLVFDDLVKPKADISDEAQAVVYDRLKFDTDFNFQSYQDVLADVGFNVLEAHDFSAHLKTSYEHLANITQQQINCVGNHKFREITITYQKMAQAVDRQDLGWGLYVCRKKGAPASPHKAEDRVQWVYASSNNDELTQRYDQWSSDYDVDLAESFGWVGPKRAAEVLARYVPTDAKVLDAGAGTGLVGRCLADLGYGDLTGIDLSPGMLKKAEEKGVYRAVRRMVLGETLDFKAAAFDAVISVGVLTLGHAPAGALRELIRIVRPGGHIVFTIRPDVYENAGFKEMQALLESEGLWMQLEVGEPFQTLPKGEPDVYHQVWVYKVA